MTQSSALELDTVVDARVAAVHAIEAEFGELANRFRIFIRKAADTVSPGLAAGTYKVLSTIGRLGPVTLSGLAEHIVADKASMSRAVRELELLGMVTRTPDPNDGRSQLLHVTELGAERLLAARLPEENRLVGALSDWSIDDIERLGVLLHALNLGIVPAGPGASRE